MISGKDIVIVAGVRWGTNPGSQQQIPLRLSRQNRVLYVNPAVSPLTPFKKGLKEIKQGIPPYLQYFGNMVVLTPRLLPFNAARIGSIFSKSLKLRQIKGVMKKLEFKSPVLIVGGIRPEVLGRLGEALSIYLCVDDYISGADYLGASRDLLIKREQETLSKVDLVVVLSQRVLDKKRAQHKHVFCIPSGCDAEHFKKAAGDRTDLPSEVSSIDRPTIGFMGYINNRIDFDLVHFLATERPNWSFLFVGAATATVDNSRLRRIESLKNVHMIGFKPKEVIPDYVRAFDVCLIPYVDDEFNRSSNPIKLYEYLATGKPIVSSRIPAVSEFEDIVYVAGDKAEFLEKIDKALAESDKVLRETRKTAARQNDWNAKAELYSDIITRFLEKN